MFQTLFSSKDKSKKLKCHLQQFLFGPVRVKKSATELKISNTCTESFGRLNMSENHD